MQTVGHNPLNLYQCLFTEAAHFQLLNNTHTEAGGKKCVCVWGQHCIDTVARWTNRFGRVPADHTFKNEVFLFFYSHDFVVYWRNILCSPAINPAAAARDMQLLNPEEWSEFLLQLLLRRAPTFISVTHTSRAFLLNRISQCRLEKSSSSDYVEPRLARTTSTFPNAVSAGAFTPKAKKNFMLDTSRTGCVFITCREASYFCDVIIKQQSSCLAKTPQAKIRFFVIILPYQPHCGLLHWYSLLNV